MIEENTGMITETNDMEHATSGRRKLSRERGKDRSGFFMKTRPASNLPVDFFEEN